MKHLRVPAVFLLLASCGVASAPQPPAAESSGPRATSRTTLTVLSPELPATQRIVLVSPRSESLAPRIRSPLGPDDPAGKIRIEFDVPGSDTYLLALIEFDPAGSTFETLLKLPLWLDGPTQAVVLPAEGSISSSADDPDWARGYELAETWSAEAMRLGEEGKYEQLERLEMRVIEDASTYGPAISALLNVYRVAIFAALTPDPERLVELARVLAVDDRRWSLVCRQLPVLASSSADLGFASALLGELARGNPSLSVRVFARQWLLEQSLATGDDNATAELRRQIGDTSFGDSMEPHHPLRIGAPIPRAILPSGIESALARSLGQRRPLLIMLWSPWCGLCESEFPWWRLARDQLADDLDFLAVVTQGSSEEIDAVSDEFPMLRESLVLDERDQGRLAEQWRFSGIPHMILVSPDGKIAAGSRSLRGPEILVTLGRYLGRGLGRPSRQSSP